MANKKPCRDHRLTIRFRRARDRRDIKRAARVVSEQRGTRVDESTLLRELGLRGIREILAEAETGAG